MSEVKTKLDTKKIESFLQGSDPQQFIVAVEAGYNTNTVDLIINDPETGKRIEKHKYSSFLWFKEDLTTMMNGGKRMKMIDAGTRFGVKITRLRVSDDNGHTPDRLAHGYKFMATCSKSYNDLINYFKQGGVDVFSKEFREFFVMFSPTEQFLIQTGKRLFKGMEDYDDVHRLQFDLETEGLFASKHAIFQIGIKDNRDNKTVLEATGNTYQEKRDSERLMIEKFFRIIEFIKPDIIAGYNSENFDWPFIFERAERLSIPVTELAITLNRLHQIKRKPSTVKLGGETEAYNQTNMWGYNIIDVSHAVRRAMAINSEIKSWGLKYITQYSEIAKPNRVYVPGDKINTTWSDKINDYAFNEVNGDWYIITNEKPLKEGYVIKKGDFIVQRYLIDDLWETEQIDNLFNQASFLIGKMLPTGFQRSSTMGTAGQWKLLMAAWSYENGLAIPETQGKKEFTGGLSRLLEVGYSRNVVKLDYAALYPKTQLTHGIFPDLDISGVMEGMLTYVVDTRDKYKFLTGKETKIYQKLEAKLKDERSSMSESEIADIEKQITEHKALSNLYDKKQLPLKILANSWFGSYGAPYIFNWGDTDSAEETTCRGRQYLRLMVKHFTEKHGFRALVGDSVTHDTPVYIKYENGFIDIQPICDLFNEKSEFIDKEKLRDFENKPYEILTVNGWKKIKYVFRHATDKKIHRIITKDRLVNVTEDHSLFQNSIQIKPSTLIKGDVIDVYDKLEFNNVFFHDISEDKAWLYGFFLGDGSSTIAPRIQKYKSRKTGKTNINKGKRSDWKISNSKLIWLEKLKGVLENEFGESGVIKDHMESSSVYNLVVHNVNFAKYFSDNFYTSYREKKIPKFMLNAHPNIKKAFIEGVCASDGYGDTIATCASIGMKSQVAMAGIGLLMKELGIDYKISTRKDKPTFITFKLKNDNRNLSKFTDKTQKKTNEVWVNEIIENKDKNNYVYDVSTEDGTFIGGIGLINLKNTDGFNFSFPDNVNEIKYVAKGSHWKTTEDAGKELTGLDAVLAEFNENYMYGRMGLDIDDICNSTINFSRKNYANDIGGKIKLVGNSVKSKKMSVYIEDFLGKAIRMLLDGDGHSFIQYYHEYVDKIYNYQIPLVKIASKAKVKATIVDYKKKANMTNKNGKPLPKQAHMELAIQAGLDVNLGDTIYYINKGSAKSHGDLKTINKSKLSKKDAATYIAEHGSLPKAETSVQLNCNLIAPEVVEKDFEMIKELEMFKKALLKFEDKTEQGYLDIETRIEELNTGLFTDEYNVARYLDAFNKKVKPLLVCFNPEIRDKILLDIIKIKDKATKKTTEKLKERTIFTKSECELCSGKPNKDGDQDSYEDLMRMEDKEIKFWDRVKKVPNNMEEEFWNNIRDDYYERMRIAKLEGIQREKNSLDEIFKHLEVKDLNGVVERGELPIDVFILTDVVVDGSGKLISRKWNEPLCTVDDIFKYENEAVERDKYYQLVGCMTLDGRYQQWLDYITERKVMTGDTSTIITAEILHKDSEVVSELLKDKASKIIIASKVEEPKKKKKQSESDEDDDEVEEEEDSEGDIVRTDDKIQLDDEFDDTKGEMPEGYIIGEKGPDNDGWPF